MLLDFAKPDTLRSAMSGVDTVFLLGTGIRGQIEAETNVVDAARAAGVGKLVKLSSWGAQEEQFSIARMHRAVERNIEASGIAWTFLRPNGFMQNFLRSADSIRVGGTIAEPAGDARISHVDVRDIARVAALVLTTAGHDGKAYSLSGPEALSYAETAAILARALGKTVTYIPLSDQDAQSGMLAAGIPDFYVDAIIDLNRVYRGGAGAAVTTTVEQLTGHPATSFDRFAREHALLFR